MSNVKLCDDCGNIFAEGIAGSSAGSTYDPETGRQTAYDACPDCATEKKNRKSSLIWRKSNKEIES